MILCLLPQSGFDPTESAVPWKALREAGIGVTFATPDGKAAHADPRLVERGFGLLNFLFMTRKEDLAAYGEMAQCAQFRQPLSYDDVDPAAFSGLLIPGGHEAGVKSLLESARAQAIVLAFFRANKPVAAVCHGVLLLARTIDPATGKSVLHGRRTTALTAANMELPAWLLTAPWLGSYYRTYPQTVEAEVRAALASPVHFRRGPFLAQRDSNADMRAGFTVLDGNYLSARWPGDCHRFAREFVEMNTARVAAKADLLIRSSKGSGEYWRKWVAYSQEHIADVWRQLEKPSGDPSYRPQYCFFLMTKHLELMLRMYSAGEPIDQLSTWFEGLLCAWEESKRLGVDVYTPEQQRMRSSWKENLNSYITSFWAVGLALALDIDDPQWQRLLSLIGNEGEDVLLDRVIASRQHGRPIGDKLCHPKPYARLLAAIDGPELNRAGLLQEFVLNWYPELDRPQPDGKPYWYAYGDHNFEGGAYFGRWCIEAVAAARGFGLDDSRCVGHPFYPGDLLRPDGPRTHPARRTAHMAAPAVLA